MRPSISLIGKRFGLLVPKEKLPSNKHGNSKYLCECDCGETAEVYYQHLTNGKTKSCGCNKGEFYKKTMAKKARDLRKQSK